MFNLTKEEYAVCSRYNIIPELDHIKQFCNPNVPMNVLLDAYEEILASINSNQLYSKYRNLVKLDGVTIVVFDMVRASRAMERIGMPEVMAEACSVQLDGMDILIIGHRDEITVSEVNTLIHHELIHIQQYRQGRLKPMTPTAILWDNVMYMVYRPEDGEAYYASPWEVEAYAKSIVDSNRTKYTEQQQEIIDRYAVMVPTKDINRSQLING